MYRHLETMQRENELLAGIYMKSADEMEDQEINLPNNVGELQEMLLQARHSIIEARVGWESERMKGVGLTDEVQLLRGQLAQCIDDGREQAKRSKAHAAEFMKLRAEYEKLQEQLKVAKESNVRLDQEFKREMDELREQNIQLIKNQVGDKQNMALKQSYYPVAFLFFQGALTKSNEELKTKCLTMQQNLANGEAVQQDFVRLSQSLQVCDCWLL